MDQVTVALRLERANLLEVIPSVLQHIKDRDNGQIQWTKRSGAEFVQRFVAFLNENCDNIFDLMGNEDIGVRLVWRQKE